jgi:hypothetical protein
MRAFYIAGLGPTYTSLKRQQMCQHVCLNAWASVAVTMAALSLEKVNL